MFDFLKSQGWSWLDLTRFEGMEARTIEAAVKHLVKRAYSSGTGGDARGWQRCIPSHQLDVSCVVRPEVAV